MRMNIHLVKAFQFFHQFYLVVRHKPSKEQIIPDALSRLTSTNDSGHAPFYLKLDASFVYYITLVKIYPDLVSCILESYAVDN